MIIDITGTILIPGNSWRDCPANGLHPGIECACDECDYLICCTKGAGQEGCETCQDSRCPRNRNADFSPG